MKKIVYSEKCLEYSDPWHIENPRRVETARRILLGKGYEFIEPKPASEREILKVHSRGYVERIKSGKFFDPDTPAYPNIFEYAKLAAGGAILASEVEGFSLMRPPGHHAGTNGLALGAPTLGFCYFNNVAIAVKNLDLPTLILDIDGHHGNGTQEIFLKDPMVQFISLHRKGIYPGTGLISEANCLNCPLGEVGDEEYLKNFDRSLGKIDVKNVEVIAISAGFDSHKGDLSSLGLSSECFRRIGERIKKLSKPTFGVLEGGYVGENVGNDLHELIQGLREA